MPTNSLVDALAQLQEDEFVHILARALEVRAASVSRLEWEEARYCLARLHRFHEGANLPAPSKWEVLLIAPSVDPEMRVENDPEPSQEGGHCGHTLTGYAKLVICPICGERAELT